MFQPSPEQLAIFKNIESGQGDLFIDASAGSGKTTSLVEGAKRLPANVRANSIFCAFNSHIVKELRSRLPQGMEVKTIHGCGWGALNRAFRPTELNNWVDGTKYKTLSAIYLASVGISDREPEYRDILDGMQSLVRFAQLTLADPANFEALEEMAAHFDVELLAPEKQLAGVTTVLQWGAEGLPSDIVSNRQHRLNDPRTFHPSQHIDFTDMLYLPIRLELPMPQFRAIFVDESQDLSAVQLALLLKMRGYCGRIFFVGDAKQAIYAFAGADSNSVTNIIEQTGAKVLPLNTCYRCPVSHLKLAQEIVPVIKPRIHAPEGTVTRLHYDKVASVVKSGDLILCRCVAPLIDLCFELILADKSATVRGRDIGQGLKKIIDAVERMPGYQWEKFDQLVTQYSRSMISNMARKDGTEMQQQAMSDRASSLLIIWQRRVAEGRVRNAEDLRRAVDALFSDEQKSIVLSTIHKAKGLEANRVFLHRYDLLPHPMATQEHAIEQEEHLKYIALTRSKEALFFIEGKNKTENFSVMNVPMLHAEAVIANAAAPMTLLETLVLECQQGEADGTFAPGFASMVRDESASLPDERLLARLDWVRNTVGQQQKTAA